MTKALPFWPWIVLALPSVPHPTAKSTAARNSTQSCSKGKNVGKRVAISSIRVVLLPTPSLALLHDPQFSPGQESQGPAGIRCLGGDVGKSCCSDFAQCVVVACLRELLGSHAALSLLLHKVPMGTAVVSRLRKQI